MNFEMSATEHVMMSCLPKEIPISRENKMRLI